MSAIGGVSGVSGAASAYSLTSTAGSNATSSISKDANSFISALNQIANNNTSKVNDPNSLTAASGAGASPALSASQGLGQTLTNALAAIQNAAAASPSSAISSQDLIKDLMEMMSRLMNGKVHHHHHHPKVEEANPLLQPSAPNNPTATAAVTPTAGTDTGNATAGTTVSTIT